MNEHCPCISLVDPPVVVRDLDDAAVRTLKHHGRQTPKLRLALACGMTTPQFKKLTPQQQRRSGRPLRHSTGAASSEPSRVGRNYRGGEFVAQTKGPLLGSRERASRSNSYA